MIPFFYRSIFVLFIKYINKNFHAVRFDVEQKETIDFGGKKYEFVEKGSRGYNQFAADLLGGKLSYPAIVFLDEKFDKIQSLPGYKDAEALDIIINYFVFLRKNI